MRAGYTVRAVVRDKARPDKVDHILAINDMGFSGHVELYEADLGNLGSYDSAIAGCVGICHCGAVMGRPGANNETPQEVFDGSFTVKAKTIKRFVQTSSLAAVAHGPPADYEGDARTYMQEHIFSEADWTTQGDDNPEMIPQDRNVAYAAAKKAAELALYDLANQPGTSFDACAIHPTHVLGPLKALNNDDYLR
eukprot:SAG11_NODE_509_length_8856_cov_2.930798_6_plen_194_part_00